MVQRYLVVLSVAFLVQSLTIKFETSSNASQYQNLENLIGSLHNYAHKSIHLIVRDTGLTKSQQLLLKRYENVEVVLPTYTTSETTRLVDVRNEFISINGTLIERISDGNLLYVDSIRKRFLLAIVIPLIRSQLTHVTMQLNMSKTFLPCRKRFDSIDLIFYHNEASLSPLEEDLRQIEYVNKCYRSIHFLAGALSERENQYPLGSAIMWKKLLLDEQNNSVSLRTYGYTHFFLMEPDTLPIRQYWLDEIVKQITQDCSEESFFVTNWWMSGSIYRGSKPIGQHFLHINGNALYHLSSKFTDYVKQVLRDYTFRPDVTLGYDLDMFLLLFDNTDLAKQIWHKFRFSDFIQNCWHTGCPGCSQYNCTQFALGNPSTYLVHGCRLSKQTRNLQNNHRGGIAILCLFLIFMVSWRCRCYPCRLNLRRSIRFRYK